MTADPNPLGRPPRIGDSLRQAMDRAIAENHRSIAMQVAGAVAAAAIGGMAANPNLGEAQFTPSGVAAFIAATSEHLVPYLAYGIVPEPVEGEPTLA